MPLYEYVCRVCHEHQERYIPASDPRPQGILCRGCDGMAEWAGLSLSRSRSPQPTGALTAQGQLVQGRWGQDAPRRNGRLIKKFN